MVGGAEGQRGRREATVLSALYGPVLTGGGGPGIGIGLTAISYCFLQHGY